MPKGKVTFDYENQWGRSKFMEFLFNVWWDFFKWDEVKGKYMKPSQKKIDTIYASVKKVCDYYQ